MGARVIQNTNLAGMQRLAARIRKRGEMPGVLVGVPKGAQEEDGTSLPMIAAAHEFGVRDRNGKVRIPERSFLRSGIRENVREIKRLNVAMLTFVANGARTMDSALGMLGQYAVGRIKEKIRKGPFHKLAPETIRRKKSSKPLIDTGNLRQSITYVLDDGRAGAFRDTDHEISQAEQASVDARRAAEKQALDEQRDADRVASAAKKLRRIDKQIERGKKRINRKIKRAGKKIAKTVKTVKRALGGGKKRRRKP